MKISDPRKLPSGNYRIQLRLDGKSISITAPTSKECKHKAELIKAEYLNGKRSVPDSSRTLSEAIDKYIKDRNSILSPTTIKGYRAIQRNRFQSVMNRKLSSINDWQSIINKESEKVSAKYIYNAWGLIASVISSERLSVPRVSLPQKIRKERTWLDSGDILKLIEASKGDEAEAGILLGLHSLRMSEALAVDVTDIYDGNIHIRGSVVRGENGIVHKETNKNSSSRRTIPILIPRLNEILPESGPLVKLGEKSINAHLNKICTASGITPVTMHELRHSFVALCVEKNIPVDVVMKLGGWSDYATLKGIYTHISEATTQKYAEGLKDFFR